MAIPALPTHGASWDAWAAGIDAAARKPYVSVGETNIDAAGYGDDIDAALAALPSGGGTVWLTKQLYPRSTTIQNNGPNRNLRGTRKGSTQIRLTTSGIPLIQNGTDSGNAYDSNEYDGPQGLGLFDLTLAYLGGTSTALSNGQGTYGPGTYGIRDWRGGDVTLERVRLANFETGFWGVQSDVNNFTEIDLRFCKTGIYAGPRCDQFSMSRLYSALCDRALDIDSAHGVWVRDSKFVGDGTASINPIRLLGTYSRSIQGALFESCWFEHLQGAASIEAFVELGVGSTNTLTDIAFRDPWIYTNAQAAPPYAQYFVKVDNADHIFVQSRARAQAMGSLAGIIRSVHATNRNMTIEADVNLAANAWSNGGASTLSPLFLGLNGGTSDGITVRRASAQSAFRFRRVGDSQERFRATVDGQLFWGTGALAGQDDASLVRAAAGTLAVQSASNGAGFLQASPVLLDVNTSTFTTSAAIDGQVFPTGVTAVNGVTISDQTNHLLLARQGGKWYKTAALTQIA